MHFRDKVNDKAVKELPETSIVIKTQDKSSEGMKTIAKNAADLGSKLRELQDKAHSLSKEKATLNANFDKAKKELTEAKKKFNETQDAMDGLKMEAAQANFDNLSYQFRSVSKEAEKARKEIENLDTKANKSMNSSGGIGGGFKSITNALVTMQAAQMIGGAVQGSLNTKIGSALGSDSGTLASSMISSVLSGAITGSAFGPLGVLAGATVGGITGAISGSAQRYESQDSSFKSYVQDAVQEQLAAQSESLTSGSSIAAGRETDKISFATLFGSKETADSYLTNLVGMANSTPFLYDDLTSMSKTLATYGYDADSILPVLQTIGDAGAALGQSTNDMTAVATAIGRMKSSNKTTLEYLNILNDRGIGAVGMLSDAYGVDQGTMYSMISKGEVAGQDAARIILDALSDSFAGSMEAQSKTFSGITSTIEGLQQELDNAMGEGYGPGTRSIRRAICTTYLPIITDKICNL